MRSRYDKQVARLDRPGIHESHHQVIPVEEGGRSSAADDRAEDAGCRLRIGRWHRPNIVRVPRSKGKISLPEDLETELLRAGISLVDITLADGLRAGALPRHHNDPLDRMLVAQAQRLGMTLVTRDAMLAAYGVQILAP